MHRVPALWRLHEFHHAAEEFNSLTSAREHPLEKAINMAIMTIPALLIGLPTTQFAVVTITFGAIGLVKHSAIPWHGWFGKYVIQSPRDHFIHHSRVLEHHNRNFANYFPVWDHLFGTYYEGNTDGAKLGLDRDYFNQTDPVSESIATEVRFFKRAGQAAKAQLRRLKHAPQPKYETRLAAELSAQKYAASCRQGDRSPDLDRSE
jgi:sterol desaturase/sphingolipid hydroxylase (fatty acid hydroxylase superfamily)